jgi:hypothetical protein
VGAAFFAFGAAFAVALGATAGVFFAAAWVAVAPVRVVDVRFGATVAVDATPSPVDPAWAAAFAAAASARAVLLSAARALPAAV